MILPLFLFFVWIVWVPSALLDKRARGDQGGMSILPVLPLFPLVAWGVAAILNRFGENWGTYSIGGFHALLLIWFVFTGIYSAWKIRQQG